MAKRKWSVEEIEDYRETHRSPFYFNKDDANFLVPKAFGIGRTVNWANPLTWAFAVLLVAIILGRVLTTG